MDKQRRPSKKNSMKENKKHPYKKSREKSPSHVSKVPNVGK